MSGGIDLMVHRRLTVDDNRGLVEPLTEPGQFGDGLMVRGKHLIFLDEGTHKSHRLFEEQILQKPQFFIWNKGIKIVD